VFSASADEHLLQLPDAEGKMKSYLGRMAHFAFSYGPAWMRRFIVRRLAGRAPAVAEAVIPMAIQDEELDIRLTALDVVADRRRRQDWGLLFTALHDPHAAVRTRTAQILGEYRSVDTSRYLQASLRDTNPDVRAMAAWGLGQIPTNRFSPVLEYALRDRDSEVRAYAAEALGRVGKAEALVPLRAMAARDPIHQNREVARQAIVELERRTAPPDEKRRMARLDLTQILLDSRRPREERLRAKECLIRIKGESVIPILRQALADTNDTQVHLQIVEILASLTPCQSLQETLIGCLHHISSPVRRRAIVALGRIGDKGAIYYLLELAREADAQEYPLDLEDARLARESVELIRRRTGN
jgi:HEAT repeat protein